MSDGLDAAVIQAQKETHGYKRMFSEREAGAVLRSVLANSERRGRIGQSQQSRRAHAALLLAATVLCCLSQAETSIQSKRRNRPTRMHGRGVEQRERVFS